MFDGLCLNVLTLYAPLLARAGNPSKVICVFDGILNHPYTPRDSTMTS